MFKKATPDLSALVERVQTDVTTFVAVELRAFIANPDKQLSDSVVANIAFFDLPAMETERGNEQLNRLMSEHYDQMLSRRLKQLLHSLYIRYGLDPIETLRQRVVETMSIAYTINVHFIKEFDQKYQYFWLIPLIKNAYNTLVLEQK